MKLIKLNAIESTNSYLKELSRRKSLKNFTVVAADSQTEGRGQVNAVWQSEHGKNLTFSVFSELESLEIEDQFYLSKAIAVGISLALCEELDRKIKVKWPNDILADGFKIAGVLIENSVKKAKVTESIIGIGLNVHQMEFENLPMASSLKKLCNRDFDMDDLLKKIIDSIKVQITLVNENKFEIIDQLYFENLYKLGVPSMYKDLSGDLFMAKILTVLPNGQLQLELQDESIKSFDLKELIFM